MIYLFLLALFIFVGATIATLFVHSKTRWLLGLQLTSAMVALFAAVGWFISHFVKHVEFLHPWAFLLLILLPAVLLAYSAGQSVFSRVLPYSLTHLKIEQASFRVLFTRWLPPLIYTLALLCMIVALARPVRIDRTVLPPTEGIDIMLLMDVSASMQNSDFYPNRFVAAQRTAQRFIDKRPTDRIGVVAFATNALLQAPLTLDHDALQEYISSLYLGIVDANFTAIGDGLAVATNHLKDSKAKSKVIILLTDGDSNAGAINPMMAAKAAQTYNIRVYTIGTAAPPQKNPYANAEDEINEGLLMEIAQTTGGKFYRASNETELNRIYDTINELEKTAFTPATSVTRTECYHPFLLGALVLLLMGLLLEKIFLIKVP